MLNSPWVARVGRLLGAATLLGALSAGLVAAPASAEANGLSRPDRANGLSADRDSDRGNKPRFESQTANGL